MSVRRTKLLKLLSSIDQSVTEAGLLTIHVDLSDAEKQRAAELLSELT